MEHLSEIYIKQLIRYYELDQEGSIYNQRSVLNRLKTYDQDTGNAWQDIMDYWHYTNTAFHLNLAKRKEDSIYIPEDLGNVPKDDSLVVVVLGIKLNDDGSMNDELIGRLEVGLALAKRYPKAYIVVTGGPTAKDNKEVTEGQEMGKWLISHGINKNRIIIEDRAPDTVGNAVYTYDLLRANYPQVDSILLVSSDYHVPRGCLLYYSTLRLAALKIKGKQLKIVSNVGFYTGSLGYETIALQAWSLCQVADIDYWRLSVELE